jgi:hypothetical protein
MAFVSMYIVAISLKGVTLYMHYVRDIQLNVTFNVNYKSTTTESKNYNIYFK